jgi:hypothetical protein
MKKDVWLDRVIADELVDALREGAPLRPLVEFRDARRDVMDLQFRRPSRRVSRVSLYAGLTRILDIDAKIEVGAPAELRFLIAHETHRRTAEDYPTWASWQPLERLAGRWPEVARYLLERERWFATAEGAHHVIEGRVHAAMCRGTTTSYRVLNREASPSFRDQELKDEICGGIRAEIRRVLDGVLEPAAWLRYREFGTSPDILAVDDQGRVVVAEAKPSSYTSGIVKGPIQVRFYAGLIAAWVRRDHDAPEQLRKMLEQRVAVGLSGGPIPDFRASVPIVPVLAIGPGKVSDVALRHAKELRSAVGGLSPVEAEVVAPTEIWRLDEQGDVTARL